MQSPSSARSWRVTRAAASRARGCSIRTAHGKPRGGASRRSARRSSAGRRCGRAPRVRGRDRPAVPDAPHDLARPRDGPLPPQAPRAPARPAVRDTSAKYAGAAEEWSEEQYADSRAYLRHRADVIVSLGPRLVAGDRVLDLACGDGGLAAFLQPFEYLGVDASEAMVRAARARGARVELADLNEFEPAA